MFQFSRDISGLFILVQFYPLFQKIRILSVPGRVQSKITMARSFSLGWSFREGTSKISDFPWRRITSQIIYQIILIPENNEREQAHISDFLKTEFKL